jgi:hypothetical protein
VSKGLQNGQVAQVVERSPEKAGVGGSTPSLATMFSITCILPQPCSYSILFQNSRTCRVCLDSGQQSLFGSRCGFAKTCTDAGQVLCRKFPDTTDCFDALPESRMGTEQPLHHSHFGWYIRVTVQIN